MYAKVVILILAPLFTVFCQDETHFDLYTISGVPWRTKDTRRSKMVNNFMGEIPDNNYRPNSRYLEIKTDEDENYKDYKKWDDRHHLEDDFGGNFTSRVKNYKPQYQSEELESEYGTVLPPSDTTGPKYEQVEIQYVTKVPRRQNRFSGLSHVQKITKNEAANLTRRNLDNLLRKYMNSLYVKKYESPRYVEIDPNDIDGEKGKFFGGGLETLALIKNKTKNIAHKFLNVFEVIKFNNTACQGTLNGFQYTGTCYLSTQCISLNGTAGGSCADGYGVCCIFRGSCGSSASRNCSYFESPNYPDFFPSNGGVVPPTAIPTTTTPDLRPDPRLPMLPRGFERQMESLDCTFRVSKGSSSIQQMRIDFLDLELLGPSNGTCINERLVISGSGLNNQIPVICGYNTGQHVYVDVSMLNGPLMLSVLSDMSYRKRFRIRICQFSQMACVTPNNCLQYYTGVSGVISSFNYDQALMLSRSSPSYFNNLNYAICIRREAGYCSITYTNVMNGLEYPFQLVNFASNGQPTVIPGQAGIETFNCPNDYIIINGARLCGYKLNDGTMVRDLTMNAPVTDNSLGPIVVQVRTNGAMVGRGFKLFYTQNRCPTTF